MFSCKTSKALLNTSHLDYLYEELPIDGSLIGTEWIYCEAPNYKVLADDDEGYTCVDDVARSLVFYCRAMNKKPSKKLWHKIETLSNFLLHMQADNGYFYNFMFHDGNINKTHINSLPQASFWTWRAYWAMTELLLVNEKSLQINKTKCNAIVNKLEQKIDLMCDAFIGTQTFDGVQISSCAAKYGTDQMSVILNGLANHYTLKPSVELKKSIQNIGQYIIQSQICIDGTKENCTFLSWENYWHAWGNSQSYALLKAGKTIGDTSLIQAGLKELNGFYLQLLKNGFMNSFKVIKNDKGNLQMVDVNSYDQIAYGVSPMVLAATEAYHITHDKKYARLALDIAAWYFGNNTAHAKMYDINSGKGFDGINASGKVNVNSGAESTIESLIAMQAIESLVVEKKEYKQFVQKYLQNQTSKN